MEKKAEKNGTETEEGTSVDALVSADFAILYHKLYMVLSRVYKALVEVSEVGTFNLKPILD